MKLDHLLKQPGIAVGLDKAPLLENQISSYINLDEYIQRGIDMNIRVMHSDSHIHTAEDVLYLHRDLQIAANKYDVPTFSQQQLMVPLKHFYDFYGDKTPIYLEKQGVSLLGMRWSQIEQELQEMTIDSSLELSCNRNRPNHQGNAIETKLYEDREVNDAHILLNGTCKDGIMDSKFILGTQETNSNNLWFVADDSTDYHRKIAATFNTKPMGGGWVEIDQNKHTLAIFGQSAEFGYEPRLMTGIILSESFPDYDVSLYI